MKRNKQLKKEDVTDSPVEAFKFRSGISLWGQKMENSCLKQQTDRSREVLRQCFPYLSDDLHTSMSLVEVTSLQARLWGSVLEECGSWSAWRCEGTWVCWQAAVISMLSSESKGITSASSTSGTPFGLRNLASCQMVKTFTSASLGRGGTDLRASTGSPTCSKPPRPGGLSIQLGVTAFGWRHPLRLSQHFPLLQLPHTLSTSQFRGRRWHVEG